jgi:hypothetical protein
LNISFELFYGYAAATGDKVSTCPKDGFVVKPADMSSKLFPNQPATNCMKGCSLGKLRKHFRVVVNQLFVVISQEDARVYQFL